MRGLDAIEEHVPELRTRAGKVRVVLAMAGVIIGTTLFFLAVDRWFAEWMPDGEIVVLALGFLLLSRFFSQRERYRQKYGARAYQASFSRFALPGLGILGASFAHLAYMPGPEIPDVWWKLWLVALGCAFIAAGLLLWFRAVTSFGIDSLVMVYVYHPSQGPRLETGLYGLLRHPIYAAAMDICFGLALIHANWYALLVALIIPLFFFGWVRLFEEAELLQRFPDYAGYRRRVPAFAPRLTAAFRFWRLLLTGKVD